MLTRMYLKGKKIIGNYNKILESKFSMKYILYIFLMTSE